MQARERNATRDERIAVVALLGAAYPSQPLPEASVAVYAERLAGFPVSVLQRAAERWIDRNEWMPKIAELRATCHAILEDESGSDAVTRCARCSGTGVVSLPVIAPVGTWYPAAYACRSCDAGFAMARPSCTHPGCSGGEGCGGAGHHRKPPLPSMDAYTTQTERRLGLSIPAEYARSLTTHGANWLWHALGAAREATETGGRVPEWWTRHMQERTPFEGPGPERWDGGEFREQLEALIAARRTARQTGSVAAVLERETDPLPF